LCTDTLTPPASLSNPDRRRPAQRGCRQVHGAQCHRRSGKHVRGERHPAPAPPRLRIVNPLRVAKPTRTGRFLAHTATMVRCARAYKRAVSLTPALGARSTPRAGGWRAPPSGRGLLVAWLLLVLTAATAPLARAMRPANGPSPADFPCPDQPGRQLPIKP